MGTHFRMFATQVSTETVTESKTFDNVIMERKDGGVGLVTLNRPKQLNALCYDLFSDLHSALSELDRDPSISAIVLTGSEKAFAAGADIKEMKDSTHRSRKRVCPWR